MKGGEDTEMRIIQLVERQGENRHGCWLRVTMSIGGFMYGIGFYDEIFNGCCLYWKVQKFWKLVFFLIPCFPVQIQYRSKGYQLWLFSLENDKLWQCISVSPKSPTYFILYRLDNAKIAHHFCSWPSFFCRDTTMKVTDCQSEKLKKSVSGILEMLGSENFLIRKSEVGSRKGFFYQEVGSQK